MPYLIGYNKNEIICKRIYIFIKFQKQWKDNGLNDDDLRELELFLLKNTEAGDMIQGTGGV